MVAPAADNNPNRDIIAATNERPADAVLKGTRLRVGFILECLSQGMTGDEIERRFPGFDPQSLPGLFGYCANQLSERSSRRDTKQKDSWDKAQIVLPFIATGLLALVGVAFTASYQNSNQLRDLSLKDNQTQIQKAQMVAQFMPYLTGKDEDAKRIAVRSIKEIGGVALAIDVVNTAWLDTSRVWPTIPASADSWPSAGIWESRERLFHCSCSC